MSICWLVCQHDTKTNEWISMKRGKSQPRVDPIKIWCGSRWRGGIRNFLSLCLTLQDGALLGGVILNKSRFNYVLFDIGSGLIELKGTSGPLLKAILGCACFIWVWRPGFSSFCGFVCSLGTPDSHCFGYFIIGVIIGVVIFVNITSFSMQYYPPLWCLFL